MGLFWVIFKHCVLFYQKINRGIVMVNFYDCFVIEDCNNFNANVQDVVSK